MNVPHKASRALLSALILLSWTCPASTAELDQLFDEANSKFESGDYTEAETLYLDLTKKGHLSPELFFNMGTTQFRQGNSGEAILWMRRAAIIDPAMPEIGQNLAFFRQRLGFLEFGQTSLDTILRALPRHTGLWVATTCLWLALISLAAAFLSRRLKPNRSSLITAGVILGMFSLVGFRLEDYQMRNINPRFYATVTANDSSARTAPSPDSSVVIALPPGSELRILQETGPWSYVDIPGDLRGWVRSDEIAANWPLPPANDS
ncbi:MAG: SH3 domain-containing protein [Verrucomicrobiota bacterium]